MKYLKLFDSFSYSFVDDFCDRYEIDSNEINVGYCDYFAEELKEHIGENAKILATGIGYDDGENEIILHNTDNDFYNINNFTKESDSSILDKALYIDHVWVYYNGKHYDSNSIDGVEDFLNLSTFRNQLY